MILLTLYLSTKSTVTKFGKVTLVFPYVSTTEDQLMYKAS